MSISILIPVYNFNVTPLVNNLFLQCRSLTTPFEIRCYDDCSLAEYRVYHNALAKLPNVIFKYLPYNIGRARIRNMLAREAQYENLIFLDCDSRIIRKDFIEKYIYYPSPIAVLIGGTEYSAECPKSEVSLRWKYGREREARPVNDRNKNAYEGITLNNIFIKKEIYLTYPLDENIKTYGHEDTRFGYELLRHEVSLVHIDNPVEHIGLEANLKFLEKTDQAVKNFFTIVNSTNMGHNTKIYKAYSLLKKAKVRSFFLFVYSFFKKPILQNLQSSNPSLFLFDLYKLQLFVKESKK